MGAIVLTGAGVLDGALVGAVALLREGVVAPPRYSRRGRLRWSTRELDEDERGRVVNTAAHDGEYRRAALVGEDGP